MKIPIDQIQIKEETRIRKEIGNLGPLQESIEAVGLINPILIDEQRILLAGYRRLAACRNLGWKEVEVRVVELSGDQLKMLDVEVAENFFRKDFTPEEILSTERRRNEILEEMREKSLFERFWLWLKQLFSGKPVADKEDPEPPASAVIQAPVPPEPTDAAADEKDAQHQNGEKAS
jgi:ParB family chromosome partitioning protein